MSWVRLLKRVFALDLEQCPNSGGDLKIIAAMLEQPVIEKILTHLGLQVRAPPRAAERGTGVAQETDDLRLGKSPLHRSDFPLGLIEL